METRYPEKLMTIGLGYWQSKVVLTAAKLKLFTLLGQESLEAEQIRQKLKLHGRGLADFLDSLFAMGLLTRENHAGQHFYGNTPETLEYMVEGTPRYIGGALEMFDDRFVYMSRLEEALRTGENQNKAFTGMSLFDDVYSTHEKLIRFANGMTGLQLPAFAELARRFDFSAYQTHHDIGGSLATLSIQLALQNPHLRSVSLDLPYITEATAENIRQHGVQESVKAGVIDFFKEDFPKSDVFTMGMILHDWDQEQKRTLIRKAYEALNPGGALIAVENIIDDEREKNLFGLLFSLVMLIETEGGYDFTFAEFDQLTQEAGFQRTELTRLAGPVHAAVAYK